MKPILEIRNISKKFQINHETVPYMTMRDRLQNFVRFKKTLKTEEFYALKDVSFNVKQGETIGIIGKNGAGKSTLLKILSRITPPSAGSVTSRGRIASLLEVGTGFHAELTGRENIFLNGSILGMKRKEIHQKFDAIVDFSGVEKFLDTPLKHYSSGMQLRLAFAVAAFLEPEILIIDEVLAVGDSEFQKKCMGKMSDVSKSGRTVLFVSHNLSAVVQLCNRGILLQNGQVTMNGPTQDVVDSYLMQFNQLKNNYVFSDSEHSNAELKLNSIDIHAKDKSSTNPIFMNEEVHLEFDYTNLKSQNLDITIELFDDASNHVFHVGTLTNENGELPPGNYVSTAIIPANLLNSKTYFLNIIFGKNQRFVIMKIDYIAAFSVEKIVREQSANSSQFPGIIHPQLKWTTQSLK